MCVWVSLPVGSFNSSVQPAAFHGQLFLLGSIEGNWPHPQSLEGGQRCERLVVTPVTMAPTMLLGAALPELSSSSQGHHLGFVPFLSLI